MIRRVSSVSCLVLVLCLALACSGQRISQHCFGSGICYKLSIPTETATSGEGDIFFQISGPTSNSWIALGQGSSMAGSSIFVMYADGRGNVTVSPRKGEGHSEPEHTTGPQIQLLSGSGVTGGMMTANVRCSNCQQWDGGNVDFKAASATWIFAQRSGPPLSTSDLNAEIEQHQEHGSFIWDLTAAKGGDGSLNPFLSSMADTTVTMNGAQRDGDDDGGYKMIVLAHGVCAGLVFLGLFPVGGILIRLGHFPGAIWIHAGLQSLAYLLFVAAAGLGIYIAKQDHKLDHHHPIIGMVLLAMLFFQPVLGLVHHELFKKRSQRNLVSHVHIWLGRSAIVLGMINGGLGLMLAENTKTGAVAGYSVVAGVMFIVYMAAIVVGETGRIKKPSQPTKGMGN